ncbi:MAG: transglycosylase SLT domain-containing protein [Proteobacteria bacterium]|nr:transglycosylase SLT domain-containing protein [Pseudomonadota bacterium]
MKNTIRLLLAIASVVLINGLYQVGKKPAELLDLLHISSYKASTSTWEAYKDDFENHATRDMTAEFLAALAQAESAGNPWATPEWKWRLTTDITRIYAPASSSVGLFQYTEGTFKDGKRFCVHFGKVVLDGKWYDPFSCWFNWFYSRTSPSDSIEVTAARLQHYVDRVVGKNHRQVEGNRKRKLAAVIHLCGTKKGRLFAKSRYRFSSLGKCGSHDPARYYRKINSLHKHFISLSQ